MASGSAPAAGQRQDQDDDDDRDSLIEHALLHIALLDLACVVDDAASGVNLVVRGEDLRPSTPTQRLLQRLLELAESRLGQYQWGWAGS